MCDGVSASPADGLLTNCADCVDCVDCVVKAIAEGIHPSGFAVSALSAFSA